MQDLTVMKLQRTKTRDKRFADQVIEHHKQSAKKLFDLLDKAGGTLAEIAKYREYQRKLKERAEAGLGIDHKKVEALKQIEIQSVLDRNNNNKA